MAKAIQKYKTTETSLDAKTGHKIHVVTGLAKKPVKGEKVLINGTKFEVIKTLRFCTAKTYKAGLKLGIIGTEVKK